MNKEKSCIICDACLVFFIGLLYYILIFYAIPQGLESYNKLDFKITKEECSNLTEEIGFDNFEEQSYGLNENIISYEILDYGFYKIEDIFCISNLLERGYKDFILDNCEYYEYYGGGYGLEIIARELISNGGYFSFGEIIDYQIYPDEAEERFPEQFVFNKENVYLKDGKLINDNKLFYVIADVVKDEEVCEEVEVEETKICEGEFLCKDEPECCLNYYLEIEELSIDWLDRNCKFDAYESIDGCGGKDCILDYGYFKCGEYKVEVSQ